MAHQIEQQTQLSLSICFPHTIRVIKGTSDFEGEANMATGWTGDGAVQDQIDATVSDAVMRAKRNLPTGPSLSHCEACNAEIPEARRQAMLGVRLCVACQEELDREAQAVRGYNRRGSKDSLLR
jgi:phage/conjugal plasmid C-4 type zinc finger TraR family protein